MAINVDEIPRLVDTLVASGAEGIVLLDLLQRESAAANHLAPVTDSRLDSLMSQLAHFSAQGVSITLNLYRDASDSYVVIESDGEVLLCSEHGDDIPCGNAAVSTESIQTALLRQTLSHRRHLISQVQDAS
jgi:hypothetical protein